MNQANIMRKLTDKSLYLISYSDGVQLLYAPLADSVIEVSDEDVCRISNVLSHPETYQDNEARMVVNELINVLPISSRKGYVAKVEDFINFTILPTNRCNFSCSFCYSRAGRGNEVLEFKTVRKALNWFVETCRKSEIPLHITFYGGGEPMLVWNDILCPSLHHITKLRHKWNTDIIVTLITNGSIMSEGAIKLLRDFQVDVVVSFEVIEDLQNIHRRNHKVVSNNIKLLIDNGINPRINAVITEDSVNRQSEIIETLHTNFPQIDYISLEPKNGIGLSSSFYSSFIESFFAASDVAHKLGLTATCSALRNCDVTVDRYCAGELALTPTGKITLCPCISSESQHGFEYWIYGDSDENGVTIDKSKLHQLLSLNLYSMPHCYNCFARYNCGGGCLNNYLLNGSRHDKNFCTFTRTFLKRILRQRYDKSRIEQP